MMRTIVHHDTSTPAPFVSAPAFLSGLCSKERQQNNTGEVLAESLNQSKGPYGGCTHENGTR